MGENDFKEVAAVCENPRFSEFSAREGELYEEKGEVRSPFARDYTRVLHCTAYRRLKHKTQVFYNIENDHICTRMEHVLHVESAAYTIAKRLKLNDELTRAIAMAHDLGHAPFGHHGERIIGELYKEYLNEPFWHEKNGLYLVDKIELLPDHENVYRNLNLTYAVRDGILSHCGEMDKNGIKPRKEHIDLYSFTQPGQYEPATYEGCVVKLSDKIAYVGRDIEDAINLGFLSAENVERLQTIVGAKTGEAVNTSTIMSEMILDVCSVSTPEKGICLSEEMSDKLNKIKAFNNEYIYKNKRFEVFNKYAGLVIGELFNTLYSCYNGGDPIAGLSDKRAAYPALIGEFCDYLFKYCNESFADEARWEKKDVKKANVYKNVKVYESLQTKTLYARAVLDYIAGMTDRFAVKCFNELITY
ncbi:MAG: HD domain-containing protein [Candidatus Borkfalkiaceae bacterium]|nr:HD domain-containing protein [Clostridia bacterium]MDY6223720.1 HD domain-containing protein [Christensenellaceae bacterium]